jgi:hypothetical protein
MKRYTVLLGIVCIIGGLLSWSAAQSTRTDLFDVRKSQQELEIMRGILGTTVGIVSKELRGPGSRRTAAFGDFRINNISGYYLYGQGATFTIPVSTFRFSWGDGAFVDAEEIGAQVEEALEQARESLSESGEAMAALKASRARTRGTSGGQVTPPPAPPAPPTPAAPPSPLTPPNTGDLRKKLSDAQEQVKKRRELSEQQAQKIQETMAQVKGYLIEALANYGDSLTVVKPTEYINLVISSEPGFEFDGSGTRPSKEVISVQRSVITDYKAGRITLDGFKQKLLQYAE